VQVTFQGFSGSIRWRNSRQDKALSDADQKAWGLSEKWNNGSVLYQPPGWQA